MRPIKWQDALTGGILFALGDSLGALIGGEFLVQRMLGMIILGGTLYAWEIPNYFQHLARRFNQAGYLNALQRTLASGLFFNPLWIARHMLFIQIFAGQWQTISADIFIVASWAFIYGFPFSLLFNYLLQNVISMRWRFLSSSIYSALTVIYYALLDFIFQY